jgi:hypothetical protein
LQLPCQKLFSSKNQQLSDGKLRIATATVKFPDAAASLSSERVVWCWPELMDLAKVSS